ncbi:MAG: serine/threonine protein kinase [Polyangiaceae bacterium]|nr:serine/threonine protein kinase [Polyangiaceae bacterium]
MGDASVRMLGRYALYGEIAAGGMATVHLGRLLGPEGFAKTVAIKQLHPQFAKDPDFVSMFLDEGRLAARIQHPNVVSTLDVISQERELFLVMEYIEGESLARLIRAMRASDMLVPPRLVGTIMAGALYGLHAAHEAKNERGEPLGIIHRDVSPQNILVGIDGVARVLDFGVAKAANRSQITREGQLKGKLSYMAPEQILEDDFDRRVDIYAAGVVLWESLCARRLFDGENEGKILKKVLSTDVTPPSQVVPGLPPNVDDIVMRALSKDPSRRFSTAWEFAVAVEEVLGVETPRRLGAFVEGCAKDTIQARTARVRQLESGSTQADGVTHTLAQNAEPAGARAPRAPSDPSAMERTVVRKEPASTRAILAILAILGAGATGALGILLVKRANTDDKTPAAEVAPTTTAGATALPPRGADGTAAPPPTSTSTVVSAQTAAASADTTTTATATNGVATSKVVQKPTAGTARTASPPDRPTAQTTASTAPTDPCKSPHYYENGIKKIKPQCLKQ